MKRFFGISGLFLTGCMVLFTAGCGGGLDKKASQMRTGIDSLKAAGAPDSSITNLEVILFQFLDERKRGRKTDAKKTIASGLNLIVATQASLGQALQNAAVQMDSLKAVIQAKTPELSGVRVEIMKTGMMEVDSLLQANRLLQAKDQAAKLAGRLPLLLQDEITAKEIAPKILGTWERVATEKNKENHVDNTEREKYSFNRDQSVAIEETKKGSQGENLYFDYQYISSGNYTLNGDSVKMQIKRLKGFNRNKVRKSPEDAWIKVDSPPFDSLVTNGSEDRAQTYTELKQHFKKK